MLADAGALPWWGQLGIAGPFAIALAFIGKWLLNRLDEAEKAKDALYQQIIGEVVPALAEATATMAKATEAIQRVEKRRAS